MDLAEEYRQQFQWRDWATALAALPSVEERVVIDLGCGVGDLAAELAARGARVVGLDGNRELLAVARSRRIPNAEFRQADLGALPDLGIRADGLWCSFVAAYFPSLAGTLSRWAQNLEPGGWVMLVEVDDLFGHEPLGTAARARFDAYVEEALAAGRYDFRAGSKLAQHLGAAGFRIESALRLRDEEFSFDGPAAAGVVEAWSRRLERMVLLEQRWGESYRSVRDEFLGCLRRTDHRSTATVRACLARKS
ncbi:MAG TPA: class I SAM-dependent methyltransferase [Candidatus Polarisedimenticolaceae bacterium]|nr:class I SAM-dependent methyltransferase [Candidatus Polarisedimenticolaceae bacterium]